MIMKFMNLTDEASCSHGCDNCDKLIDSSDSAVTSTMVIAVAAPAHEPHATLNTPDSDFLVPCRRRQ